jgi:hypothetical protein
MYGPVLYVQVYSVCKTCSAPLQVVHHLTIGTDPDIQVTIAQENYHHNEQD